VGRERERQRERERRKKKEGRKERKERKLKMWLKWQSACLANVSPRVQTPVLPNE
jgi:hypothetical protein